MTTAGWIIMTVSVGGVFLSCAYCVYRVLTLPAVSVERHMHAPLDINTGDSAKKD